MVMMGKLVTKDEGQNRQFKLPVYQPNKGRGQTRCNFRQRGFQDRFRSSTAGKMHTEAGQGMDKIIEEGQDMNLVLEVIMEII